MSRTCCQCQRTEHDRETCRWYQKDGQPLCPNCYKKNYHATHKKEESEYGKKRRAKPEYKLKKKRWDANSYARNKGKRSAYHKQWRIDNIEHVKEAGRKWYASDKERIDAAKRDRYQKLDLYNEAYSAFLDKYGRSCCICGFSVEAALQCEHINGGGTKQRLSTNRIRMYQIFVEQYDYWKDFVRVTCANCNIRLAREQITTMDRSAIYRYKTAEKLRHILNQFVCQGCGECDKRVLTFDHIHDDGADDRKKFGQGLKWWYHYTKNPELAGERIQLLCYNCQFIKKAKVALPILCVKV